MDNAALVEPVDGEAVSVAPVFTAGVGSAAEGDVAAEGVEDAELFAGTLEAGPPEHPAAAPAIDKIKKDLI